MNQPKKYLFFFTVLTFMAAAILLIASCKKEHSCEGCLPPVMITTSDTTVVSTSPPPLQADSFPGCSLCQVTNEFPVSTWNFKTGNAYVCGDISDCGFIGGGTTFTFFGPSSCSSDTGLVMTVYFSIPFDHDVNNVTTHNAAFYYYDNNAPKDIFIRESATPFSVTVQSFTYATGLTTGTFSGTVYKADSSITQIEEGNFKILLK